MFDQIKLWAMGTEMKQLEKKVMQDIKDRKSLALESLAIYEDTDRMNKSLLSKERQVKTLEATRRDLAEIARQSAVDATYFNLMIKFRNNFNKKFDITRDYLLWLRAYLGRKQLVVERSISLQFGGSSENTDELFFSDPVGEINRWDGLIEKYKSPIQKLESAMKIVEEDFVQQLKT